jgi:two-component system chemotaxis response regulator CheY
MLRDMLAYTLNNGGYKDITECSNGLDGLKKANLSQFDLIISDINMPKMDGLAMISEIRQIPNYKSVPILVLTTERRDEMKQKSKEAGASGWINKPFVQEKLLKAVETVLNKI